MILLLLELYDKTLTLSVNLLQTRQLLLRNSKIQVHIFLKVSLKTNTKSEILKFLPCANPQWTVCDVLVFPLIDSLAHPVQCCGLLWYSGSKRVNLFILQRTQLPTYLLISIIYSIFNLYSWKLDSNYSENKSHTPDCGPHILTAYGYPASEHILADSDSTFSKCQQQQQYKQQLTLLSNAGV